LLVVSSVIVVNYTDISTEVSPIQTKIDISIPITATTSPKEIEYTQIEWLDLLPEEELYILENPPAYLDEIEDGSPDDILLNEFKSQTAAAEDRYQQALSSKNIRAEFNSRHVRIPGFIVPLEFNDQQMITAFFFVPYFGACIHMPPPPPNQMIYGEYKAGIHLDSLYDPFWIEGTMSTTLVENEMATAAYSINVAAIKPYTEDTRVPAEELSSL
jgi:hypothetical protein